eukprot:767662-Hanusia_phi.AAC.3
MKVNEYCKTVCRSDGGGTWREVARRHVFEPSPWQEGLYPGADGRVPGDCCYFPCREMTVVKDFSILDYRVNMRLDNLPVAEIAKFYYEVEAFAE